MRLANGSGQQVEQLPQVVINLQKTSAGGYSTSIQSNIKKGPEAWRTIIEMIQSALRQAVVQEYKDRQGEETSRIVVPNIEIKGL